MASSSQFNLAVAKPQATGLEPITPAYVAKRYETKKSHLKSEAKLIEPGMFSYARGSEPRYLPEGWAPFVQPEGQLYFARDAKDLRVATDAHMYIKSICEEIVRFTSVVGKIIESKNIALPASAELYLRPDPEDGTCGYYFVDHATHALFWLEPLGTDDLGLDEPYSELNLRYQLEELYWMHVEYFPSHRLGGLNLALDELIAAFIHAQGDQLTSLGSTFPYTAKQCKDFLRILCQARDIPPAPQTTCMVARIWGAIVRSRHQIHYGQEHARLDRNQHIIDEEEGQGILFSIASRILLGVPANFAKQLERTWSDNLVYVHVWHDFMTAAQNEWRQHFNWSLGMSIVNLLLLLVPSASSELAGLSLACCGLSAIAALALLTQHHSTCVRSCSDALPFLEASAEDHHRCAALLFALPRALFLWAVGITAAQGIVWLERATHVYVIAALAVVVFLANLPWGRLWSRIRAPAEEDKYDRIEKA